MIKRNYSNYSQTACKATNYTRWYKRWLYSLLIFSASIVGYESHAQTDITNTYLSNPGFDINCNYLAGNSNSISSSAPPLTNNVSGWNLASATSWGAVGTFEFGWQGLLNGSQVPAAGANGASGSGQGALGTTIGWGGDIVYSQAVTLPAGLYEMKVVSTFVGANTIAANLTGWVANDGSSALSDFTSSSTSGNWTTTTISFRLTSQTAGNIQVGVRGGNSGTGSNAKVFTDEVKLYSLTVTKVELQSLVDQANTMIVKPEPVPAGSTVYAELQAELNTAQAVLNNASAGAGDILKAEDAMNVAILKVEQDVYSASLTVYDNYSATMPTFSDSVKLTGVGQITLTSSSAPIVGGVIDFATTDTWVYFPNMVPSAVVNGPLAHMTIEGKAPVLGDNIRVTNYLEGAMVMAHASDYAALTVYAEGSQTGSSMDLVINQHYKTAELGAMNDNIESFILRRGYMATFAANADGTGGSRVYIADDTDVIIDEMPEGLVNTTSMVVVRQWRWTTKKGWRGSVADADRFNCGSFYDYNNADYGTLDREYVPMRHNPNWNSYDNFHDKYSCTHALGYNEPDNSVDDGFSTVADAIAAWPAMMESGLRLGAPATTDGGLSWTYEFMNQADARGYRVDFVAWHFYRANHTAQQLYNQLLAVHNNTGRPIWITEFNNGCNWTYNGNEPGVDENAEVIQEFIAMLEDAPFVERYYVWDGCNETLRMTNSGTGELYPAGEAYKNQVSTMAYSDDFYNSPVTKTIQENEAGFCGVDGTIDTDYAYTGSGAANTTNEVGSGIDYKINFMADGTETLTIRYASATDRPGNILVNGSVVASLPFLSTGGFGNYLEASVNIPVQIGTTDIRIEATSDEGLGNVDYIEITGGYPASCESNPSYPLIISASEEEEGNPATNILDGNDADNSRWSAFGFPQTVIIDYGEIKRITGTRVSTYQDRAYQFTVELSDNLYFTNSYVVDRSNNTSNAQPISDNFSEKSARYVRITITGASGYTGTWSSLTEFDIVENSSNTTAKSGNAMLENADNGMKIYPNPASDVLNVNLSDDYSGAELSIYNNFGRMVMKKDALQAKDQINISALQAGIYYIKISHQGREENYSFIKQ
ncbi:glycosyl hydrolase [Fulvivirga sediminis]|uniref:T9SS type A sorting domain-containing protein n=1 Tax=Fulvivirga sediminis TaxID=2803949 RepID=A0A937K2N6_9BACT|nr:glycosyl hydrolase [Fulvivirga sediminis]MBL3658796.1 T9SS type A sorting domain-containing protein [Fulvivirga sediminis]